MTALVIGDTHHAKWIEDGLRGDLGVAVRAAGATVVVFGE